MKCDICKVNEAMESNNLCPGCKQKSDEAAKFIGELLILILLGNIKKEK